MTINCSPSNDGGTAVYFIQGEVVPEYGYNIIKDLVNLKNDNSIRKLKIIIQSQMGCYSCCNAIYDLLVSIPYEIECYALGAIQGAPMSIFMAGVERYMSDSTRVFLGLSNKTFSNSIEKDAYDNYLSIITTIANVDSRELKRLSERNASLTKLDCANAGLITASGFPI